MRVPTLLQIESSTACDGKCVFCPHSTMKRKHGTMSEELFDKIIAEAATLRIPKVLLFLNGEPFIFPRLFQWMDKLRANGLRTDVFTNASHLTKGHADKLVTYHDIIDSVVFSLSGVDVATHMEIMGLDFNKVHSNIEYFMSVNGGRIRAEGHMPLFSKTARLERRWRETWGPMLHSVGLTPMFNWGGDIHDSMQSPPTTNTCGRVNHMTVLWDGRVSLCCMDAEGAVILGDLNTQSIAEVFNGELAMRYYTLQQERKRADLPLCRTCNMW